MEIDGIAALGGFDKRNLPAFFQPVSLERQIVNRVQNDPLACIEIRQTTVARDIVAVLQRQSLNIAGVVVNRFGPGIVGVELQSFCNVLLEGYPERVIRRVSITFVDRNI